MALEILSSRILNQKIIFGNRLPSALFASQQQRSDLTLSAHHQLNNWKLFPIMEFQYFTAFLRPNMYLHENNTRYSKSTHQCCRFRLKINNLAYFTLFIPEDRVWLMQQVTSKQWMCSDGSILTFDAFSYPITSVWTSLRRSLYDSWSWCGCWFIV